LESDLHAVASNFELIYGEDVEEKIVWKILSEKEQITVYVMEDVMADGQASQNGVPSDQSPFSMTFHGIRIPPMSIIIMSYA
jgi:hypothetical protein